jgi:hypothetical protein
MQETGRNRARNRHPRALDPVAFFGSWGCGELDDGCGSVDSGAEGGEGGSTDGAQMRVRT